MQNKKNKILLIDGQIFQIDAWDRGMGKYMLQALKYLARITDDDTGLILLFNSRIETDNARYEALKYHCPNIKQISTALPLPRDIDAAPKSYKKALEAYIEEEFSASSTISYMITTLFSFDIFAEYPSQSVYNCLIFYDLIPLMQWKDLGGYFPPHMYMGRFGRVYESDKIFCISQTTQDDLLATFGIDRDKTCNINGGFTEHDRPPVKPESFEVPKKYILFPTGSLPHKNNELVFKAFKSAQRSLPDVHLVVISKFPNDVRHKLLNICSDNVIFTQHVTDDELQYLYKNSSLVLFGSKYEGLGLPVLDAVYYKKPIVTSRISVFTEMSTKAFFFFAADNHAEASEAIVRAMNNASNADKIVLYPEILQKYSWTRVAEAIQAELSHIPAFQNRNECDIKQEKPGEHEVAVVALVPGLNAGLGRLTEPLYSQLRHAVQPSYFFDSCGKRHDELERPTFLDHLDIHTYDISRLSIDMYRNYSRVFYLIDDAALNFVITQATIVLPGYIIFDSHINKKSAIYQALKKAALGSFEADMKAANIVSDISEYMLTVVEDGNQADHRVEYIKSHASLRSKRLFVKKNLIG